MNYIKLSQLMSYILRHAPGEYGLEPDPEGWVGVEEFLAAINRQSDFKGVTLDDLQKAMTSSDKKRHELVDDKIRAVYGHSLPDKIEKTPARPPEVLYHGTPRRFVDSILKTGLSPKERQYVHLSRDVKTAGLVGRRRDGSPAVLIVEAGRAWRDGHRFYQADEAIWLADTVPPEYIRVDG